MFQISEIFEFFIFLDFHNFSIFLILRFPVVVSGICRYPMVPWYVFMVIFDLSNVFTFF